MDPIDIAKEDLINAITIWTGYGRSLFPVRNDKLIMELYGDDQGNRIISYLDLLKNAFYLSDAKFRAPNLKSMGDMAIADFKTKHPNLDAIIYEIFSWCYTYDYK